MNFIIFLIFTSFSLKGSVCFPLRESSKNLNPGFGIEISKNFKFYENQWGFLMGFKSLPFKSGSQANFNIFSLASFISVSLFKNFYTGFRISYSFLNLHKLIWEEEGLTGGGGIFFKFIFGKTPFFMEGNIDFLKGKRRDLWIFNFSLGI